MTNKKISDLTAASTTGSGDLYVLVQGGVTKKIDFDNLSANITPADASTTQSR